MTDIKSEYYKGWEIDFKKTQNGYYVTLSNPLVKKNVGKYEYVKTFSWNTNEYSKTRAFDYAKDWINNEMGIGLKSEARQEAIQIAREEAHPRG